MKRLVHAAYLMTAVVALSTASVDGRAFTPTSLTFFGDSLSDSGNGDLLLAQFGLDDLTPTPPYAPGVVSNGAIWTQHLATSLGRTGDAAPSLPPSSSRNFAIGTARTGMYGASGLPIGMLSQLSAYGASGLSTDPTGLYAVFGGANDIFDAATLPTEAAREDALATAVDNLATLSEGLYDLGARHFLVPNAFDVGQSPAGMATDPDRLGALSRRFNAMLAASLAELATTLPGSTFYGLSLDTLQANVAFDAMLGGSRYGLTNIAVPCFSSGAPSCDVSAFADDRHPTSAMHTLIAQAAYARVVQGVDVTPVPEPGTAVLFALGIGAVGAAVRRTRRGRSRPT